MSNDSDIATPYTSTKHLIAVAQAKREQACFAGLPHSVSSEETENSILFISSPSPIRGSSSNHIHHSNFTYMVRQLRIQNMPFSIHNQEFPEFMCSSGVCQIRWIWNQVKKVK